MVQDQERYANFIVVYREKHPFLRNISFFFAMCTNFNNIYNVNTKEKNKLNKLCYSLGQVHPYSQQKIGKV